ncbi:cellulose synthase complex periplasmic endoglucanase BcsZ [Bordetella genomosp. 12]|uniref:cellulase n=1 Tax=Bordetella genomosp. 12 TaxID=463035 RepID=A0A261VCF8_9BORD|nr:cellulose synthase complex periplasmic endoglucanase BcsZ [Bordetella genomosp. 12]OZI70843.1 endo-1,4-D-glucanase [Bordetella genomosp. 12]
MRLSWLWPLGFAAWRLRAMLAALLLGLSPGMAGAVAAPACAAADWPQWSAFVKVFVQPDGRVLDDSTPRKMSSSEGQSYGMFFALLANDRAVFDRLWRWSVANLAAGDVQQHLPAWSWGKREDGSWGVLDANAASDADLWFTYALLEAGRVWGEPAYTRDGLALLAQIEARELVAPPGLGNMLLPAPEGFAQPGVWRFNPSYMPIPVLRRLAQASPKGPWDSIAVNTLQLIRQSSPLGYVADWVAYESGQNGEGKFGPDPVKGAVGSYDAVRTYMWAGMTDPADPLAAPLMQAIGGLAKATAQNGVPPEKVNVDTGALSGTGPFGFSAALLPYLRASGQAALLESQLGRVRFAWAASLAPAQLARQQPPYYDYVLSMFSTAWLDSRYRFRRTGQIQLEWEKSCPYAITR